LDRALVGFCEVSIVTMLLPEPFGCSPQCKYLGACRGLNLYHRPVLGQPYFLLKAAFFKKTQFSHNTYLTDGQTQHYRKRDRWCIRLKTVQKSSIFQMVKYFFAKKFQADINNEENR